MRNIVDIVFAFIVGLAIGYYSSILTGQRESHVHDVEIPVVSRS